VITIGGRLAFKKKKGTEPTWPRKTGDQVYKQKDDIRREGRGVFDHKGFKRQL